jgi:uncharacterized protein YbbC (DUF1343 family)
VTDRSEFEPVSVGVAMVKAAFDMYPSDFRWKVPPYEYVFDKNPFDVISGTDKLRQAFEDGVALKDIINEWQPELEKFLEIRTNYLLY